jgi:hypothetical protein
MPTNAVAMALLIMLFPLASYGQGRYRLTKNRKAQTENKWQKKYSDSIVAYRDSLYAGKVDLKPSGAIDTAPFFSSHDLLQRRGAQCFFIEQGPDR